MSALKFAYLDLSSNEDAEHMETQCLDVSTLNTLE